MPSLPSMAISADAPLSVRNINEMIESIGKYTWSWTSPDS